MVFAALYNNFLACGIHPLSPWYLDLSINTKELPLVLAAFLSFHD